MQFISAIPLVAKDHHQRTGRPFVTLSYAQSLDGCISGRQGEALALSGRKSLVLTHKLRASHHAILVGIGTVFSDNPRLTVRLVSGNSPIPIVLDSKLRIPLDCKLVTENSRPPWIITVQQPDESKSEALRAAGATVMALPADKDGLVNLDSLLNTLGEMGVHSIMVEGGARIITNFLMRRLANSVVLTLAPVLVNGLRGVSDLGRPSPERCLRLRNHGHRRLGEDIILWGDLV